MFARAVRHVKAGGAIATAAAITLIAGSACKTVSDCYCSNVENYASVARGVHVVPAAADTSGMASATFNIVTFAYEYYVTVSPSGTIDSIALYQAADGEPLPASATAIFCAGATACAAARGTATLVAPATRGTIHASMDAYRTQLVFFTTTAQKGAGGALRGTMYLIP